jgi:AcrR family transcriptional regulator
MRGHVSDEIAPQPIEHRQRRAREGHQYEVRPAPIAQVGEQLGTSPRMLMFYFKSKEGLIKAVLGELHARLTTSFARVVAAGTQASEPPLQRFWHWAASEQNLPALRLLYELQIVAAQNPAEYARYLKKMSLDWQAAALRALSEPMRSGPMATLCIAVFDGLFLELICSGDRTRLEGALRHFIAIGRDVTGLRPARRGRPQAKRKKI